MSLLLAPYNDSMRLGMGFNSFTHTICVDHAVKVSKEETVRSENPSQIVTYSSKVVESLSETVSSMNISYCTSIRKGTIEIAGSTSAVQEDKIKQSDLNAIVAVKVVNQTTIINDNCEFQPLPGLTPGTKEFDEAFGDCYISGFIEGGDFNGIISMRVVDRSNVNAVASVIKKSLGSGSGKDFTLNMDAFTTGSALANAVKDTETTISVSWMGGGQVKEAHEGWDFDTIFSAAAAFPARVAQCPQKTWAILTKYKANRSFQSSYIRRDFVALEYDAVASYTMELFENFMEYKQLTKLVQSILASPNEYEQQTSKPNSIGLAATTLIAVKAAFRQEMNKIVAAVNVLSRDPEALHRNASLSAGSKDAVVQQIMNIAWEIQNGSTQSFAQNPTTDSTSSHQSSTSVSEPSVTVSNGYAAGKQDTVNGHSDTALLTNGNHETNGKSVSMIGGSKVSSEMSHERENEAPAVRQQLNFDFGRLIPPEIWSDLLPVPTANGTSKGASAGGSSTDASDMWMRAPLDDTIHLDPRRSESKPKLTILAAVVGMTDLTDRLQEMVTADQQLAFSGAQVHALATDRPEYKTLPYFPLQMAILYQYTGGPIRLITVKNPGDTENNQSLSVRPDSQDSVVTPTAWSTDGWTIVAVTYGGQCFNDNSTVMNKIQQQLVGALPRSVLFSDDLVGTDPWFGHVKLGMIFYRARENGRLRIAVGIQNFLPATMTDFVQVTRKKSGASNALRYGVLSAFKDAKIPRWTRHASGSMTVQLAPPLYTTPRVLCGLRWIDWVNNAPALSLGIDVDPYTVDEEGFMARAWSGADSNIYDMEASWLALPRTASFQMDSGYLEHGGCQSSGDLGNIQSVTLTHRFKKPFSAPPKVVCWFANLDLKQQGYHGLACSVSSTSNTEFSANVSTWADLHFAGAKIGWFAYDSDQDEKCVKVGMFKVGNRNLKERWQFPGTPFRSAPAVFCAISHFDFETRENIRTFGKIENADSTGADVEIGSWLQAAGNETMHGLTVRTIALELP